MKGFNFSNDLKHQTLAINSVLAVFKDINLEENVKAVQDVNGIKNQTFKDDNTYDICMQTGTGKTYTYTKTMFMLNEAYGYDSFIVLVPTLAIKSGTKSFFELSRQHFIDEFQKSLSFYEVKSEKSSKSKKEQIPQSIKDFCRHDDKNSIRVLLINAGMLNSDTFKKDFDSSLFDRFFSIFPALASTKSVLIIDEPHKFDKAGKTWENVLKLEPKFILRYGATFKENSNLLYNLTPLNAFNENLVKGIKTFVQEYEIGSKAYIKLKDIKDNKAIFIDDKKREFSLIKGQNFNCFYDFLDELFISELNKSKVLLSNGIEIYKENKFNPFSFNDDLIKQMINSCLDEHFKLEREFLNKKVKIKPLSLFFIDDISSYRGENARLKEYFQTVLKSKINDELKDATGFYKEYLQKSLDDISLTHGGYFSKDNSDKDDKIEQEINEILHDKMSLLSLENTRRFIFSKWTLKEGWDNPNVFNICKLRRSGSEISKLQEVGRGLRLPVDEYGCRQAGAEYFLNYFVDASESDFIDCLIGELKAFEESCQDGASEQISEAICKKGKIRNAKQEPIKVKIRKDLYTKIKALWEEINKKVFLRYSADENIFLTNFKNFLKDFKEGLTNNTSCIKITDLNVKNEKVSHKTSLINGVAIKTLNYGEFLMALSTKLGLNANTLHRAFYELLEAGSFDVNEYLNDISLNQICKEFNLYLLNNSNSIFSISYEEFISAIHPTKITDTNGDALDEINASDVGVFGDEEAANDEFLYEKIFYDSQIEKDIIKTNLTEVCVYMKIPKNSLKIPVAGGFSYSPDFAYVLTDANDKPHYFVLESKGVNTQLDLREAERAKIEHAKLRFSELNISFKTQLQHDELYKIVSQILNP